MGVKLWSDNPSQEDLVGFADAIVPIVAAALQGEDQPVTVGVEGDWGSGKTTILNLVERALNGDKANDNSYTDEDNKVVVITTRPWEYDPTTDPKATLIAEVLAAIHSAAAKRRHLSDTIKNKFKSLTKRIRVSKAVKLAATSVFTGLPQVVDFFEIFKDDAETVADPTLHGFRSEFAALMEELKDEIHLVVVLVDDLDRCLPHTVVDSLEAIKLFLSVRRMAFVVAADRRAVAHAVSIKYAPSPHAAELGRQYSEKIIQIPVAVPRMNDHDAQRYLASLILKRHTNGPIDWMGLVQECRDAEATGGGQLLKKLSEGRFDAHTKAILKVADVLSDFTEGNPRRLKRFLNAYSMRAAIKPDDMELTPQALVKWMVLEDCDPESFEQLLDDWRGGKLQQSLEALVSRDGSGRTGSRARLLSQWTQMEPPLPELHADTYLQLAASLRRFPVSEPMPHVERGRTRPDDTDGRRREAPDSRTGADVERGDQLAIRVDTGIKKRGRQWPEGGEGKIY